MQSSLCVSVCLSLCVYMCVCVPLLRLYLSYNRSDFVLMKLGGNVGTIDCIKLKEVGSVVTSFPVVFFFFLKRDRIQQQREIMIILSPDCDTSDRDLL